MIKIYYRNTPCVHDKDHSRNTLCVHDKDHSRNTPCVHDKDHYRNTPCVHDKDHSRNTPCVHDKDHSRNTPCVHDKDHSRNTPCVLNWIFTFLLKKKIIQSNLVNIYYKMYNPLLQMTSLFYMVILLVYCVIMKLLKFNATIKTPDINHVIRNGSAVASPITWFITKTIKVFFSFY